MCACMSEGRRVFVPDKTRCVHRSLWKGKTLHKIGSWRGGLKVANDEEDEDKEM